MDNHAFLNRLRSLWNIDHDLLPELSAGEWHLFRDDPPRFLMRTDNATADAIMREVEKRQAAPNIAITPTGQGVVMSGKFAGYLANPAGGGEWRLVHPLTLEEPATVWPL